jgi:aspartyl-tRNA(Asn)/glutamyl-tRNA(Gln) amidotransferase subunit A
LEQDDAMTIAATRPAGPGLGVAEQTDLTWLPAWRLAGMIAAREVSPVEVVEHFLGRTEALDPKLHAFRTVDFEGARNAAKAAEKAVLAGDAVGPLCGVPVAIKELLSVKGMGFWNPLEGKLGTAARDGIEAERMRRAGAIIVGTTVAGLTALEFGDSDQQPRNPWDEARVCGDSSSGSACAVASAMVPLTVTTDGLGSTRLPAAYCGLVGAMATRGRVPAVDWSQLVTRLLSHVGPMGRDVRDMALGLGVLSGPDGRDIFCLADEAPDYLALLDAGAEGMRLVWTDDFGFAGNYAGEGATDRVFDDPYAACNAFMNSDPGLAIFQRLPAEEVISARETRARVRETWLDVLQDHDFLISPTVQHVAPTREEWAAAWLAPPVEGKFGHMATYSAHTSAANLLGWPAMSLPAGFVDGMPVGLQIVGRPHSEPRMLQLAQSIFRHLAARG